MLDERMNICIDGHIDKIFESHDGILIAANKWELWENI